MNPPADPDPSAESTVPERFRVNLDGRTLLGTYRVESKLAEGGMGSIYLARDTSLDRPVVVKVPHARFLAEPGFRARLAREIAELVRLEHPHVVRILARGEEDDIPFFVLQFLGGGSLEDRLGEGRQQAPEDTLPWLAAMARTLDFVHKRGSLHRDVKPGNILFDEEGNVFLSDFGVAKAVDAESDALTGTGVGIGSPKYMAPEQALGHDVGPAADQYGLASSLYEALSGDLPFHGTPVEVLVRKSREDAPSIRECVPDLPEAAADALLRAMARDPAERFTSCEEFARAFAAGVQPGADTTQTVRIAQPTPTETHVPAGRKRMRLVGNLLVIGLVVAALASFLAPGSEEPAPVPPARPARQGLTEVQLLDAGSSPRRLLRYDVGAGTEEQVALRFVAAERIEIPGMDLPDRVGPVLTFDSEVTVERVDDEGDLQFAWIFTRCAACDPASEDSEAEELLLDVSGFTARGQVSDRGLVHAIEFEEPDDPTASMKRLFEGLQIVLNEIATPLPQEPVGVGARWAAAHATTYVGMRMVETSEYELLAIEGDRLTLRVNTALTAPEQSVTFPNVPAEIGLTLTSFHGRGTSRLRVDLDHLTPGALTSLMEGAFEVEAAVEMPLATGAWLGAFRNEVEMFRK